MKNDYNGTVYEFDVKKLRELCASKANMVIMAATVMVMAL